MCEIRNLLIVSLVLTLWGCGGEEPEPPIPLPPQPPKPTVVSIGTDSNNLVEACIRATACDIKPYPRVSNCVSYYSDMLVALGLAPVHDTIYRCANRATTCGEVRDCFGVTGGCGSSFEARCEGGKAIFCDLLDKTTFTYDCAAAGMTCKLDDQYGFSASCAPTESIKQPSLSTAVDCSTGACRMTGEVCSTDAFDRCSGSMLQACLGGEWVEFDCQGMGLGACEQMSGGWGRCSGS